VKVQQHDHLSLGRLEEGVLDVVEENVHTITLQRRVAKTVGVSLKGALKQNNNNISITAAACTCTYIADMATFTALAKLIHRNTRHCLISQSWDSVANNT
jgi:hypothetical protein